jgi:KAP family P-loop domain
METQNDRSVSVRPGFDAAVAAREHDHLNRWLFAREIFGIATTGPEDWSVRVGIYGEWGSGKTSVLRFIGVMAANEHIAIPFNPWQFRSTDQLWRNFVKAIFYGIEKALGERQQGWMRRRIKGFSLGVADAATDVSTLLGLWKKEASAAAETGLAYLKRFLSFRPADLKQLSAILGKRRLIVLIDDLDRTDPKLVPEMLFALKEIMDVPGMAFVCAFDPAVIGKVLGQFHPGFGDGLDFLEKIIDYPRWLPDPSIGGLIRLAAADAAEYCPYVPTADLRDAVSLLPRNPRAVRQFVRLLALLRPQIQRHRADEISWPFLLAANVIKVRFPEIASEILGNESFWTSIYETKLGKDEREAEQKSKKIVDDEIERIGAERKLSHSEKQELNNGVWVIANRLRSWFALPYEGLTYQFRLAEYPHAITWKEFDELIANLRDKTISAETVGTWIRSHAIATDHSESEVFDELVDAAIRGRVTELGRAADATSQSEMDSHFQNAAVMLRLLSILILELGEIQTDHPRISSERIHALLESFARYFSWRFAGPYIEARKGEESLSLELASAWGPDVLPLVDALSVRGWSVREDVHGKEWGDLFERLITIADVKFAAWIVRGFKDDPMFMSGFFGPGQSYRIRAMLLDKNGLIWKDRRDEMFALLDAASSNEVVRRNAYELLKSIEGVFHKKEIESAAADALIFEPDIASRLWNAATPKSLNPRMVSGLRNLLKILQQKGLKWKEPDWWTSTVADLDKFWDNQPKNAPLN